MRKYEKPAVTLITFTSGNNIAASGGSDTCEGDWGYGWRVGTICENEFQKTNPGNCWQWYTPAG
jgi:hypothetical protein